MKQGRVMDPDPAPLRILADRVRSLRESRGWTRTELAARSGLSLRFLARIESGDGNVSLRRLAALAGAFGTSPDRLIRPERLRPTIVALVGLRGAGKSTLGPILARRLGVPFVEMDDRIREASGLPLDQIFELHGERYFRRLEREILGRILAAHRPAVVAAGGGVVNEPATWERLREQAVVVWLRASPEDHWSRVVAQGDRRPMAGQPDAMAELRAMLAAREPLYEEAHLVVNTSGETPEAVADAIEAGLARLPRPKRLPA